MNIKAAIFDMDGTLVDSLMLWDVLWSSFGTAYLQDPAFRPRTEDDKTVRTLTLKDAMELIHRNYGIGSSGAELLDHANRMMLDFYANRVALKPGVKEFLQQCKAQGVKMCIASATAPDLLDVAMKHCGLEKYFLRVFSCGTIGKGKEHPDVFDAAHAYLGSEKESTWVFEDSFVALQTAQKAGYQTVGIYDPYNFCLGKMPEVSTEYIAKGETLARLIPLI